MKSIIILLLIPFFIQATNSDNKEKKLPDEKNIDVVNPVKIEKLDKEVKDEKDIKKAIKNGAGEENGSNTTDPHNFKNVEDNKIKTQKISDDNEIDPTKFMSGLGDENKNKDDKNNKNDGKGKILTPNSTNDPFNDKKLVQNIKNEVHFSVVDITGNVGVRINFRDDDKDSGNTLFELQNKFNLSFSKKFTNSEFKITLGTVHERLVNDDWVTISTIQGNKLPIGLKEAYYILKDNNQYLNTQMGRFLSPFEDDYFFSSSLSFDGFNIYGKFDNGLYYKTILSVLQNENIFTDEIDISSLVSFDLGFKKDNFNISLYYTWLYGENLNTLFENLLNEETYSTHNHYLTLHLSYGLNLNQDNLLTFHLDSSFNFSADDDKLGTSFSVKHETRTFESKLTFIYKQKNSVIAPLALQENWFTSDVVGGNFKFMYKYDEAMSSGIEFSAGKSIIDSDSDLNYITRAVYNIKF